VAESRTERTPYAALMALMEADATSQGWAYPYWNPYFLDGLLHGLAMAPRTGVIPLAAPDAAPTLNLLSSGGVVPAGQVLEVAQTFVDAYGRETDAGVLGVISTGDGIPDPETAATLGSPSTEASGYGGGLLEVTYTWVDENGGETLAAPASNVQLPYLSIGLYSQVEVTLPSTPAAVGAAGANVYVCHDGGNVVLAKRIMNDTLDHVTLDGASDDCYQSPPYVSTVGSTGSIEITGQEGPAHAVLTRFYIRPQGEEWTADDRRLTIAGVTEWNVSTVIYPLVYAGEPLGPGYPPPVSLVKAIRPVDLAEEVSGVLAKEHLEASGVEIREVDFVGAVGDWEGALATPGDEHGALTILVPTYDGQRVMNQAMVFWWNTISDPPAWQILSPFLPTESWSKTPYGPYTKFPGTAWLAQERPGGNYHLHVEHPDGTYDNLPTRFYDMRGLGDYLGFFGVHDDLATLEWYWGEPWNSYYIVAYVIDTDAWYWYSPEAAAHSTGGASPSTNLSGGTNCNFKLSIDGDTPETVTLTGLDGLTNGTLIATEMQRAINALGGKYQYLNCSYQGSNYVIQGPSRDGVTLTVTDGDTLNVAADLKLGLANGGTEGAGQGRWIKNPSSAMRGTFANAAALPSAADDGDTAFVLDNGSGVPALMEYQTNSWVAVGKMLAP